MIRPALNLIVSMHVLAIGGEVYTEVIV